jgi:hypothetical protein
MVGRAGYLATLRLSGTPTATTANAMTALTGTISFQITSTARRVWDRTVAPTFAKTASTISSTDISSLDYLFGKVVFKSTHAGSVTIDLTHLPMASIAGANNYNLTQTVDVLDDTTILSTGFRSKKMGLHTVSLSVGRWDTNDLDFSNYLIGSTVSPGITAGTPIVVEVNPGGSSLTARGWFVIESESKSGDVGGLEAGDVSLQLDGDTIAAFKWSDQ